MTFVVLENCIKCKHTDCVDVCPVDCFYEGPNMLVIHPDECIDCGVCIPECPIDAIVAEEDLTPEQQPMLAVNAKYSEKWPLITSKVDPLEDSEQWENVPNKLQHLKDYE
jgi:ferredoxin